MYPRLSGPSSRSLHIGDDIPEEVLNARREIRHVGRAFWTRSLGLAIVVWPASVMYFAVVACPPAAPPRPALLFRAPGDTSYERVVHALASVKQEVGAILDVNLEICEEGAESIELTVPADEQHIDLLAQAILSALSELGVARVTLIGHVEGYDREYRLLTSVGDIERLRAAGTPFLLWFHADWVGEGISFRKQFFRDRLLFSLIGKLHVPVVLSDHTHPTDATNLMLSEYSKSRIVPTVVFFAARQQQAPTVFEGLVTVQPLIGTLQSLNQRCAFGKRARRLGGP